MVNSGEGLINAVMFVEPKRLSGSGQKASGPVQGLSVSLPQMLHHRRRGTTSPAQCGTDAERGNPVVLPASGTADRKVCLGGGGCRMKEKANAGREGAG